MLINESTAGQFQTHIDEINAIADSIKDYAKDGDCKALHKRAIAFKDKTDDFFRENRKLNIGVVGQVKAGKSSFLNTLLFNGKEILPKAATPKTATLTKMEYSDENIVQIEYYEIEDWESIEDNAKVDSEDEIYTSAREIIGMVKRSGINPKDYLAKKTESIKFDTYDSLTANLNDYVGENGKYTPLVKAVTLYLNKEEFKGLSIVDTPGLNDPIVSRTLKTKEFMEVCDVVFFLSQAGQFLDKADWTLLSSQLPQKGVKRLVLIASKYDSGIRDVLRKRSQDEDIFGEDDNAAHDIPKACKITGKKLRCRAKVKVEEFTKDLKQRGLSGLVNVIGQCSEPIMISALAYNMARKDVSEYSSEERNVYAALKQFSSDMQSDLKLLGNIDKVRELFDEVKAEKEAILEQKANEFIPNSKEEIRTLLKQFAEKTQERIQALERNDREQLTKQKNIIEGQMNSVKADIAEVFGGVISNVVTLKSAGIKELRDASKDYLSIRERSGTKTVTTSHKVSDAKWYNPFSWGSSHTEYSSYDEHYSYCLASDAVENLQKYAVEASSRVEEIFENSLNVKEIKRKLLDVVINNFDMGSEKYDSSLFRLMVEETVSSIEFPVFNIDISDAMSGIASKFNGEISSSRKTELSIALSNAISRIYTEICNNLEASATAFKNDLSVISNKVQNSLLENISKEFEELILQCANKEKEIANLKKYADVLDKNLALL